MGWRLGNFLASQRLQNHVLKVVHKIEIGGSDHCPIVMESSLATYLEPSTTRDATPVTPVILRCRKEAKRG